MALTCQTQPGSIYLLTPVGEWPIHIGFEVDRGRGVRQPAVHLPALYLTCGREDALEPIASLHAGSHLPCARQAGALGSVSPLLLTSWLALPKISVGLVAMLYAKVYIIYKVYMLTVQLTDKHS